MVLITGGFGYLGGRIANYLSKSGNTVRIGTSRNNIASEEAQSFDEIVKIDLFDDESLESACENVSIVIHLAAMNANECVKNPKEAHKINVLNTPVQR